MCLRCMIDPDRQGALARRTHVLALLALVEHPEAIPADAALRLGQEILALVGIEPVFRRCEAVVPNEPVDTESVEKGVL